MIKKQGLPEDITVLMRQLVMNGHIRMAGTVLYTYFIRCWKLDDEHAAYYMRRYLEKFFAPQLQRHLQKLTKYDPS